MVKTLAPVKLLTTQLQSSQLTPGQMLGNWNLAIHTMKSLGSVLSQKLIKRMQAREETLISPPLLAGIFLDPEFQVLLTDAQRDFAKIELQAVHKRIVLLDPQKSIIDLEALAENEENESDSLTNLSPMQRMLMSKQKEKSGNSMSTSLRTSQAIKLINSFVVVVWLGILFRRFRC